MLKLHPKFGIYDLSFKSAVKSLIKDGFVAPELIDRLYTTTATQMSQEKHYNMSLEEANAYIRAKFSPWVWLCRTETVDCVKVKFFDTANGEAFYTNGIYTRTCGYRWYDRVRWQAYYCTFEQIRKYCEMQNPDKTFVSICRKNSDGVLEFVGYVLY